MIGEYDFIALFLNADEEVKNQIDLVLEESQLRSELDD